MPVTMGGMASGMDTDAIIKKLVDVEARPIRQLQRRKVGYRNKKKALQTLKKHLVDIRKSAQALYGFRASYNEKAVESSDQTIISAKASKLADKGVRKIKIIQIASTHKIRTSKIDINEKLPSGKFSVEIEEEKRVVKFKGGSIKKLYEKLRESLHEIVNVSLIKTYGDEHILTLQSKVSGEKGEINIKGDRNFLKTIGLVTGHKNDKKNETKIVFDSKYFSSYSGTLKNVGEKGTLNVSKDGKSVKLKGQLWQEYTLPLSAAIEKESTIEFNFKYKKDKVKEEDSTIPFKVELGPREKVVIKGIELGGYNISRIRELSARKKDVKFDTILGIGIFADDKGKKIEKIYPIDKDAAAKQEIPLGKDFAGKKITRVIFYCNEGEVEFSKARIITPEKGKGYMEFKNVIAKPSNAKLEVDGIEIIRDKNFDLNDVINGLTIDIKGSSDKEITLSINPDIEQSIKRIKKFVNVFNKYVDLHKQLIKTGDSKKPGEFRKKKKDTGLFVSDMTIIRLESGLKRVVNDAYPNRADKPIKLFSQMGVSSGGINADWRTIRAGKLIIDEEKLKKAILENPEGIKMFFGSDTDGDNRTDNGMAFTLVRRLKPYVSSGRNIIATKISLEDNSLKMADEKIERLESHLKKYKSKLRQKFGTMEKAISGANMQRSWMKSQMGNSDK